MIAAAQIGTARRTVRGCLETRRPRRADRAQYAISNIQYPIIKSDPAESFYVLRKNGSKFLRSVEKSRKVFTFYVKSAQSFYVVRKNPAPAVRPLPWKLNIEYWILNIPSFLPARGRAGSLRNLEPLI
jgi:hypothetical protein